MPLIFFSFENGLFIFSTSSSSSIYKNVIAINTPTTMNNQFEALNAPQIDLHFFFLNSYDLKIISLSLSLHIHKKKTKILILNFFMVHRVIEAYDSWWLTFVCDSGCVEKTYIYSPRRLPSKSSRCRRLTWKSSSMQRRLHGSRPLDDLHESCP
ncbi:hypothetical protein IGI04_030873 [Brassica rapa subsp. trilocularis]|uniref:Transmembrane protein n=1 Tax=Brassica rapa subsp. trilocularis TaxID=1813537 RepID=A0ABQ7LRZ8_BRACM|nr:hypothetical protein IGI04_030873 [Brassica rapa subsp. trilocularis]